MFDLHLHSHYSDGALSPADLVQEAATKGLSGISLTDHNGLWGSDEAAREAAKLGLKYIEGIEISAQDIDEEIHILGYSRNFNRQIIEHGLAGTKQGYLDRFKQVVDCCRKLGYGQLSWDEIVQRRASRQDSNIVWTDIAGLLQSKHHLDFNQAKQLVTQGGMCYVPYGQWALSLPEAIDLIHRANGVAVLAHPSYVMSKQGLGHLALMIDRLRWEGLDGIEASFPNITPKLRKFLKRISKHHHLIMTGGSDWHGYPMSELDDSTFGIAGATQEQYQALLDRLS